MEVLKWIGYIIVATIGLCAAAGVAVVLGAVGATFGSIALGGFLIVLVAAGINEHMNTPKEHKDT